MTAEPISLTECRPDPWQQFVDPCPEHGRACGPWCAVLWGQAERGAFVSPQSDGHRLHAIPCGAVTGPDHGGLTAGEQPTDAEMDAMIRRAASIPTQRLLRAVREAGDD